MLKPAKLVPYVLISLYPKERRLRQTECLKLSVVFLQNPNSFIKLVAWTFLIVLAIRFVAG